jgi:hypothetical protein
MALRGGWGNLGVVASFEYEVKRRWDPDNVFRGNLNITPM